VFILLPIYVIAAIALFIVLKLAISYFQMIQKTLNCCAPENRSMSPGMVWLMLIPFVNIVWHFFVVINVYKSLRTEFQKRGIAEDLEPSKKLGLIISILVPCVIIIPLLGGYPLWDCLDWFGGVLLTGGLGIFQATSINRYCLGSSLAVLSGLILWILYWRKITRFSAMLAAPAA
jgi:hypothetical protein